MITRSKIDSQHERVVLAAVHSLRLIEALIYLGSFTLFTADWSTKVLFSDWADN